jgi:hypothetical protein
MKSKSIKYGRYYALSLIAIIIVLLLLWNKNKPIKGYTEKFIATAEQVNISYYYLKPSLDIAENRQSDFKQIELKGGLFKLMTRWGKTYILRIQPECNFESDSYLYLGVESISEITRDTNVLVGQFTRNGKSFDKYLKYEDITNLYGDSEIFTVKPYEFEVTGEKVSKKDLLNDGGVSEREKFVIRNLPGRAIILNVNGLRNYGIVEPNDSLWYQDYARFIPWLILALLLLLLLFYWKRLINLFKRNFMAQKENLQEFGYISSGKSGGDPVQFRSYLNGIFNGDISDSSNSKLSDNQMNNINSKIKELDKNIDDCKLELEEIKKEENLPVFDPTRFIISLFIFIGLTIFSYFFYLSTINKALFLSFEDIDCETASRLNILPSQFELAQAINNSYFILIVPFTVFALGWLLHMVIDNPKLRIIQRNIYLGSLLLITFTLDFLLASYIHKNIDAVKEYCGYGTSEVWYASTTFYIIIFMGFLVYIFWSLILNNILQQLEKANKRKYIQNKSVQLKLEIENIKKRKDRQLSILDNKVGNIAGSIDMFHQGWNMYMNNFPERFTANKKECEHIRNEFNEKITQQHE